MDSERRIIQSWRTNATQWTAAVREGRIESRKQVTDAAILNAIRDFMPGSLLDIGCGEGWLCREVSASGVEAHGVDAIEELVRVARLEGGGTFEVMSYEEVARGALQSRYDVVVCNFSLIGKDSTDGVVAAAPGLLNDGGAFIVQTLHPEVACGDLPYEDGWREGSWDGFDDTFGDPAPWYFRTTESWIELIVASGLSIVEVRQPIHPDTGIPASVVFVAGRGLVESTVARRAD